MRNKRLCPLEILKFDSGSNNFSSVVLNSCNPKFQLAVAEQVASSPLNSGHLNISFLIGGVSCLPACPIQSIKSEVGRPLPEFLVTRTGIYLEKART
jgi:hypothetical protein